MATNQNQYHYLFKVVLVGNSSVGKSSIVVRYADDQFSQVFLATIGVDFRFKSFSLQSNKIKLQIWDTAGHQRFRTITSSYYRGAHALMIVFDITQKQSFDDAMNYWFNQIKNSCPGNTQLLLVGNKCDLKQKRAVFSQDINQILSQHPQIQYIQTSAKTSQHVQQAFHKIAGMLVDEEIKKNQLRQKRSSKIKSKSKQNNSQQQNNQSQGLQEYDNTNNGNTTKLQSKNTKNNGYKKYCCSN